MRSRDEEMDDLGRSDCAGGGSNSCAASCGRRLVVTVLTVAGYLGAVLFAEPFTPLIGIGIATVIAGVVLVETGHGRVDERGSQS